VSKIYDLIKRIKYLREKNGLTQAAFAEMIGVSQGNVGDWERHRSAPSLTAIGAIVKTFNVSADWLLFGEESKLPPVEDELLNLLRDLTDEEQKDLVLIADFLKFRRAKGEEEQKGGSSSKKPKRKPPGMEPAAQVREDGTVYLPVLGESAAGQPIFINEILEGFIPVDKKLVRDKCFIVRAKGDSMTGRGIDDGDLVVIRRQPVVEAGEPALVRIGDESTIKYFYRQGDRVVLMSANPKYKPIEVRRPENVAVVGKVIHVIKKEEGEAKLRDSQ